MSRFSGFSLRFDGLCELEVLISFFFSLPGKKNNECNKTATVMIIIINMIMTIIIVTITIAILLLLLLMIMMMVVILH